MSGAISRKASHVRGIPVRGTLCDCGDHAFKVSRSLWVMMLDPEDVDFFAGAFVHAQPSSGVSQNIRPSAYVNIAGKRRSLPRVVSNAPTGMEVDHIDRDPLNNKKSNLRICTRSQNCANKVRKIGKTLPKGVYLRRGRIWAGIKVDGKLIYLGGYHSAEEAAEAYAKAAMAYFGEFARSDA